MVTRPKKKAPAPVAPEEAPDRLAWERRRHESELAYAAFRTYRDSGPLRTITATKIDGIEYHTIARWATHYSWRARARAWDDYVYREADMARLEALRDMHRSHQLAGRVALSKALGALQAIEPADINAAAAARLLDLGTRLERTTLATTLAELQGVDRGDKIEDPWEVISRELQGTAAEIRDATAS